MQHLLEKIKNYNWRKFDIALIAAVLVMCATGVFAVRQAGGAEKGAYYMRSQLFGILLGLVIITIITLMDYQFISRYALIYYIVGIVLTLGTHTPLGTDHGTDAVRWISLGPVTFQPTELMKICYILFIAWFYVRNKSRVNKAKTIGMAVVYTIIPMFAILSQPDLSSSLVVLFIMFCVALAAGTSYKIFAWIFGISVPLFGGLFWYFTSTFSFSYKYLYKNVYQFRRIIAWLHPNNDPGGANYQQLHSISAIASGKLYGKYLVDGGTGPRLYDSVSVNESDFVWSVIGEEFGFIGCLFIIILYGFIIWRCLRIARNSKSFQGKLISVGVSAMFMFQAFTNISVATFIFPNTGLPLPFLSNGLSSMVSSMIAVGLVLNIGIQSGGSGKGELNLRSSYDDDYSFDDTI